jgi:hypothetical protein
MKSKVINVERKNDRIITVKFVCEEKVLNVINMYVSQIRCEEKENFC